VAYLVMGFACVSIWDLIQTNLKPESVYLLVLMGAAYVVGVGFFILERLHPLFHTVWHVFVLLGASLTWFNAYFYLII